MPIDLTYVQWTCLLASGLVIGVAKAGLGSGVAILAVPLMSLAVGSQAMRGILLPILLVGDVLSIGPYLRHLDGRNLLALLPGCACGVAVGMAAVSWLGRLEGADRALDVTIGLMSIGFVALQARIVFGRRTDADGSPPAWSPARWHGLTAGAAAGLTSFIAHSAGPVVAMFLLPQRMDQRRYVGTTAAFFLACNLMKLGPFVLAGTVSADTLRWLLPVAPAVLVGVGLGLILNRRLPARAFSAVVYVLVLVAGARLVLDALV